MIDIKINHDGVPYPRKIVLGNKYENNDEIIHFDLPKDFNDYFKYVIAVIRQRGDTITKVFPIKDATLYISSDLTNIAGNWYLYLMCRESEMNTNIKNISLSSLTGEHIFISDGFIGIVRDNKLDKDVISDIPMDTNIQIVYDDLLILKKRLEELIESGGLIGSVSWDDIKNKPTEFTPTLHNHDDLYYNKNEIDTNVTENITHKVLEEVLAQVSDGKSAYEIALENGFKGTEQEWLASLKGLDGKSAYEIAVKNGFVGTEQEWLESLQGGSNEPVITQYDNIMAFPLIGKENHIYIDKSTNLMYRWDSEDLKFYTSPNILEVDVIDGGSSAVL